MTGFANAGTISTTVAAGGTGERTASDFRANTAGMTFNNAGTITGNVLLGGGTQVFNNGPSIYAQVGASPAKVGTRHVVIDYAFSSVADTTPVTMTASVDGHEVYRGPFDWNNNAGQLHFEFETFENTLIDGISFTSNPYTIAADTTVFKSGIGPGGLAATWAEPRMSPKATPWSPVTATPTTASSRSSATSCNATAMISPLPPTAPNTGCGSAGPAAARRRPATACSC